MASPIIVAGGREALVDVGLAQAPLIPWHAPAHKGLEGLIGYDDDGDTLMGPQSRAHSQPPRTAPSILAWVLQARVVIHGLDPHPALAEEDVFDALEEGGHTTGIHVLVATAFDGCHEEGLVALLVQPVELHGRAQPRQLRAGNSQEVQIVVCQEIPHSVDAQAEEDAVVNGGVTEAREENPDAARDSTMQPIVAEDGQVKHSIRGPCLRVQLTSAPGNTEEAGDS